MSVEAGLWSCLPASDATAWPVFNNNVDAPAPAPASPFSHFPFLFSSVCLPCTHSFGFIPSPVSLCDNGVQRQTVFIPDSTIISISSTSSSSLPLLPCAPMEANAFYIKPRTSQNMLFRFPEGFSFVFYEQTAGEYKKKKKTWDFNFTCTLGIVVTNKKRLLCVTVTA